MKVCTPGKSILTGGLLLCLSTAALAVPTTVTITKTDGTQYGWKSMLQNNAKSGNISRGMPKGDPGPMPPGSFYFKLGYQSETTPAQVWLGTNRYDGTSGEKVFIRDIVKLEYDSYMVLRGQEATPPTFYPSQPIQIQLAVMDDSNRWIWYLMFRPWGVPQGGDPSGSQCGVWQHWNCLDPANKWYEGWGSDMGTNNTTGLTWAQVLQHLPNVHIYAPPAGGSFAEKTPTGYGLNFVCGARSTTALPPFPNSSWWRESYNAEGSMDKFTIGVRKSNGTIEEITYDFDIASPAQRPAVFATTIKGLMRGNWWLDGDIYSTSNPYGKWTGQQVLDRLNEIQRNANTNNYLFAVCGKVANDSRSDGDWFYLEDGSGMKLPVYAQGHGLAPGEIVRVKGSMKPPLPYDWGQPRAYDHSAPGVLDTTTRPFVPTLEPTFHSFASDIQEITP